MNFVMFIVRQDTFLIHVVGYSLVSKFCLKVTKRGFSLVMINLNNTARNEGGYRKWGS